MGTPFLARVQMLDKSDKGKATDSGQMDISPPYFGNEIPDGNAPVTTTLESGEQSKLPTYEDVEGAVGGEDDAIKLPLNVAAFSGKSGEVTFDPTIDQESGLSPDEWIKSQGFARAVGGEDDAIKLPPTSLGFEGFNANVYALLQFLGNRIDELEMAVGIVDQVKQKPKSLEKRIGCVEVFLGLAGKEELMRDHARRPPYKGITKEQMMESILEALKFGSGEYGLAKEFLRKLVSDNLGIKIHESAYYTKKFNTVVRLGIASKKFVKNADNLYRLA